jgi:hypothetical protein
MNKWLGCAMTPLGPSPRETSKRSIAALAVLSMFAASFPVGPGGDAVAAASPRVLRACPDAEALIGSPEVAGQVWNDRLFHGPLCLYVASASLAKSDAVKAADLYVLARVRMRFDFARCETWPHGSASSAMAVLRMTAEEALAAAGVKTILPQMVAVARSASTYDYVSNELEEMCDGGPLKPVAVWKAEQDRMQDAAETAAKASPAR